MTSKKTKSGPTYEDAMLLLSIFNAPAGDLGRNGMELMWTYEAPPSYDTLVQSYPVGSGGYGEVMALLTIGERVGTFVKNGVLHQGLTLDLISVHAVWERCSVLIRDLREQRENPRLFENLQWLAERQRD